jgi:putative transposase
LTEWIQDHHIELAHIQPGKPAQNACLERFNRTFREDVLDAYLFDDLQEVRATTEHLLHEYKTIHQHEALQGMTPHQCSIQHA